MAGRSRIRIDRSYAAILILAAVLSFFRIPLTNMIQTEGAGYLCAAAELYLICFMIFFEGHARAVRMVMAPRMRQGRTADAMRFFEVAFLFSLLTGVVLAAAFFLGSRLLAVFAAGEADVYLVIAAMAPAILFSSVSGVLRGYLYALEMDRAAEAVCYVYSALTVIAGFLFTSRYSAYGEKVSALLRVPRYSAIYGAAGAMLSQSAVSLTILLILTVLCLIGRRAMTRKYGRPNFFGYEEERSGVRRLFISCSGPYWLFALLYSLWVVADVRLALLSNPDFEAAGSFYGRGLALIYTIRFLILIPFIRMTRDAAAANVRDEHSAFRNRGRVLIRLYRYEAAAVSMFVSAAAAPIAGMLAPDPSPELISGLQWGGACIYFGGFLFLFMFVLLESGRERDIYIGLGAGLVLQTGLCVLLTFKTQMGVGAVFPCLLTGIAAALTAFAVMSRQTLRLLYLGEPIRRLIGNILCCAASGLVVYLLSELMTGKISPFPVFLICLIVYLILYFVMSVLLKVADFRNLDRIPGGALLRDLAEVLHL